jgi:HEAT repeat protein
VATEDANARRWQAARAGHEGDAPGARRLLDDPDGGVRGAALGSLARLGELTVDDVARAAGDADPAVRARTAELAATLGAPLDGPGDPARPDRVTGLLVDLLGDPDPRVAEVAAWALGERPDPGSLAVTALGAVARRHDDALCREAAVAALGAVGDPAALPTILEALGDKATVRRRAIIALAPFEGPEVEAALRRHRGDRDRQVRQAAEDLLGPAASGPDT